ncbi:MAG: hypothetical protein KatS3mg105_4885 [Gemmatales bacterium]|nr:MAG: hypothetical protein KatS3mg105_4885 [Gemmatales bacterium]
MMNDVLPCLFSLLAGWLARHRGLFAGHKPTFSQTIRKKLDPIIDQAVAAALELKLNQLQGRKTDDEPA